MSGCGSLGCAWLWEGLSLRLPLIVGGSLGGGFIMRVPLVVGEAFMEWDSLICGS